MLSKERFIIAHYQMSVISFEREYICKRMIKKCCEWANKYFKRFIKNTNIEKWDFLINKKMKIIALRLDIFARRYYHCLGYCPSLLIYCCMYMKYFLTLCLQHLTRTHTENIFISYNKIKGVIAHIGNLR